MREGERRGGEEGEEEEEGGGSRRKCCAVGYCVFVIWNGISWRYSISCP